VPLEDSLSVSGDHLSTIIFIVNFSAVIIHAGRNGAGF